MKKRWILPGLLLMSFVLAGCGGKTENNDEAASPASIVSKTESSASQSDLAEIEVPEGYEAPESMEELLADVDLDSIVELGNYKGLELTKEITEVTDEDINAAAGEAMKTTYVDVNRAAETGDVVDIDYKAKVDGEKIDSESEDNYKLVLGSQTKIDGFEDGLIGKKAGDKVKLKLTFPRSYTTELSGKDVTYTVKINSVQTKTEAISEDWIAENTDFTSVEDYKKDLRSKLEAENDEKATDQIKQEAWRKVLEDSVVKEYPKEVLTYGTYYYSKAMENYCKVNDISLESYLEDKGLSAEDYEERISDYSKSLAGQILVLAALEKAEGLLVTDEAYTEALETLIKDAGLDEESYFKKHDPFVTEQSIMLDRVNDMLVENAVVVEKMVTADDEESSEVSESSETSETESGSSIPETAPAGSASLIPESQGSTAAETSQAAESSKSSETTESSEPQIDKEVLQPLD